MALALNRSIESRENILSCTICGSSIFQVVFLLDYSKWRFFSLDLTLMLLDIQH